MSLFDGMRIAEHGMNVHRYRSEVAAQNIANVFTPGYAQKRVILRQGNYKPTVYGSGAGGMSGARGGVGGSGGALRVAGVREEMAKPGDYRAQALLGAVEMMQSKNAFELSMRAATMMKSMALGSLEIGRGG